MIRPRDSTISEAFHIVAVVIVVVEIVIIIVIVVEAIVVRRMRDLAIKIPRCSR